MKFSHASIAVVTLAAVLSAPSFALTKDEYKAEKDRIQAAYKDSKKACDDRKTGNVEDVCEARAKGVEKVALAELEAQYKPSAKNRRELAEAKAKAAYDVADEKCDALSGDAKSSCQKSAKAEYKAAKAAAKRVK